MSDCVTIGCVGIFGAIEQSLRLTPAPPPAAHRGYKPGRRPTRADTLFGVPGDDPLDHADEKFAQADQRLTQTIRGMLDAADAVIASQQRIVDLLRALADRRRCAAHDHWMREHRHVGAFSETWADHNLAELTKRQVDDPPGRLGSRIASRFTGVGLTENIPELRGQPAQPAHFNES